MILFVCEHGSAKSVVAAAHLERLARLKGLRLRAIARGVDPDPQIAASASKGLTGDGFDLSGYVPQRVSPADLETAAHVVSFGCDLSVVATTRVKVERWDDMPAVSDGYEAARDTIVARIETLLEEVASGGFQPRHR